MYVSLYRLSLSIYLSIDLSIYRSIYRSIYLPIYLPVKLDAQVVDKLMDHVTTAEQNKVQNEPPQQQEEVQSLEKAFDKPKNLGVVTKGKGWKSRPRHLATKASWQLPIKEWTAACGPTSWRSSQHSAEFYFLSGAQVGKLKCLKREAKQKGATLVREEAAVPCRQLKSAVRMSANDTIVLASTDKGQKPHRP